MTRPPPLVTRSYSTPEDQTSSAADFLLADRRKTPPPSTLKNNASNGKMVAIKVLLLDDSTTIIQAQSKTLGRLIFSQICKQLNLLESDYFGLSYSDDTTSLTHWLDLEKRLTRQVGLNLAEPLLKFCVKFYTPDPSQLEEEFTRYLFSLQIKRDLASGVLFCNDNTAALMASFIVQAECGDFSEEDYADASYLSVFKFVPHQNYELERKIRECHKKHVGQSPAEADLHLLETSRRTEMYGIRLHPARDEDGVQLTLSVCHMGVLVFQQHTKINTFSWAKIRKISFKRKRFILKLHPESYGYYKELVEFIFDSRNECKAYWKRCVEHHAFFRCEKAPNPIHRSKGILSSRGSSFRYSGRTQKQMVQFVRENFNKRPPTGQGQYLSQQNLSTFEQQNPQQPSQQFQRSSSFKSDQSKPQQTQATRRSTGNMMDLHQKRSDQDDEEAEEEDEEFSDYNLDSTAKPHPQQSEHSSMTSSPILPTHPPLQQQQQQQQQEAPYYSTKLLLNLHRTYTKDILYLSKSLPKVMPPLITANNSLIPVFEATISSIKKHNWELKHGNELVYKLWRHFEQNYVVYKNYMDHIHSNYEEICCKDDSNYYIGLCCLVLKPFYWIEYCHQYGKGFGDRLVFLVGLVEYGQAFQREMLDISKICELRRDVVGGLEGLGVSRFLRQGVLLKLNKKKGLQSRILFLFHDHLIYCTRISSQQGFRLHGVIKTSQMDFGEEVVSGIPHSFVVNVNDDQGSKVLVLAAFSEGEKTAWTLSIREAIANASKDGSISKYMHSSSEEFVNDKPVVQSIMCFSRPNQPSHVCWHRNLSITSTFLLSAYRRNLSSYLLRKFKSSPGWQRLWVVYSNVCLYFYKSHESDENPLASLPLLGYKVNGDVREEEICTKKQHVFKLSFKNHVYYFRAESEWAWGQWVGVLSDICGG